METKLPLVVVQGSFKVLARLDCNELEVFLRYVISFLKKRRIRKTPTSIDEDFQSRPIWWTQKVPYPMDFILGAPIPYVRDKEIKLRKIVKSVYNFYHCKDLLDLSDKLAMTHAFSYFYKYNSNKSITVYQSECNSPLVTIPQDNLTYDLENKTKPDVTIHCKELSTSLSEFIARPVVKKSPMKLIDSAKPSSSLLKRQPPVTVTPIYVLSDSDDDEVVKNKENNGTGITMDSETIVIDDSSSEDDCQIVSITDILSRPALLGLLPPKPTVKRKVFETRTQQHHHRHHQHHDLPPKEPTVIARKKGKRQIKRPKYFHEEDSDSSSGGGDDGCNGVAAKDDLVDTVERPTFDTIGKTSFLNYFRLNPIPDDDVVVVLPETPKTTTAPATTIANKSPAQRYYSKDPSTRFNSDTRSRRRVASRLPYQLFELESVERLVAVNHLPPGCLIDPEEEQRRTEMKIGRYLRDIPQPAPISRTNSQGSFSSIIVTPHCWVQLERLSSRVLERYSREQT